MGNTKYVQIPLYKCSGLVAVFKKAIKTIDTKKFEVIIDSSVITIKERPAKVVINKEKVKKK